MDPREGWVPREPGLACSQRCLGALMKTKCAAAQHLSSACRQEPGHRLANGTPRGLCACGRLGGVDGGLRGRGGSRLERWQAGGREVRISRALAPGSGVYCRLAWGRERAETFLGCEGVIGVTLENLQVLELCGNEGLKEERRGQMWT